MTEEQKNKLYDMIGAGEHLCHNLRNKVDTWKNLGDAQDIIGDYIDAQASLRQYIDQSL